MKKKTRVNYKDLKYRYRLLSDLMDYIPDVIYFKDKKGRLLMVNRAHAKGLGLRPEQIIGKTDFDFFPKERAELMAKDDMRVIKMGKPIIDKIETGTRPDGVDNYVSTTKIPRYDDKGKIIGLIGITRDITYRAQVEHFREEKATIQKKLEALEGLNEMKSEFVSIVSHELRTPLSIIHEAVMLILDELAGPVTNKQKELLTKARENIARLKGIINELLDISRIEKGKLELHYSLININDLLRDSSDFFRKLAQEKGIHLEYALPKDQVNIFIDAGRINQVCSNLISNAIKFTEQNGRIKVAVKILETKVRIAVIDTGIGIAKQDLPRLFDKFMQVSKIKDTERKGVGLGLSIAKELVERHDGEIWAESRLGVGTKLYFTLPRFYTQRVLDNRIRDTINNLLNKEIAVYLVNLLIINFKEFKKRMTVDPRALFKDVRLVIDETLKAFLEKGKKKPQIALQDYRNGEWGIIFFDRKEEEITKICNLLRDKIKSYFIKKKIKDVFINLGILPYLEKQQGSSDTQVLANINIKKIYIGSEIRRFKRVNCRAEIELTFSKDETELSQTVDISKGGLCFMSRHQLETDSSVRIRLKLPRSKKRLEIKGRVAWNKDIEKESEPEDPFRYKIGLEFIGIRDKERAQLSRLIKSIS
jgi:PAS domain S-box-containing protein